MCALKRMNKKWLEHPRERWNIRKPLTMYKSVKRVNLRKYTRTHIHTHIYIRIHLLHALIHYIWSNNSWTIGFSVGLGSEVPIAVRSTVSSNDDDGKEKFVIGPWKVSNVPWNFVWRTQSDLDDPKWSMMQNDE